MFMQEGGMLGARERGQMVSISFYKYLISFYVMYYLDDRFLCNDGNCRDLGTSSRFKNMIRAGRVD